MRTPTPHNGNVAGRKSNLGWMYGNSYGDGDGTDCGYGDSKGSGYGYGDGYGTLNGEGRSYGYGYFDGGGCGDGNYDIKKFVA